VPIDWNQIRQEHGPLVWSVAWRVLNHHADALDCAQEVFVEAFQRSQKTPIDNWPGFLRWLTTHRALDIARNRRRMRQADSIETVVLTEPDSTDQNVVFEELIQSVRRELERLSQSQATAFWLANVEEMSYREVATSMQIEVNAVGVLVHRARAHLKQALADQRIGKARPAVLGECEHDAK
jgi:RNA polymerase sigma factor (sigma-70 family)